MLPWFFEVEFWNWRRRWLDLTWLDLATGSYSQSWHYSCSRLGAMSRSFYAWLTLTSKVSLLMFASQYRSPISIICLHLLFIISFFLIYNLCSKFSRWLWNLWKISCGENAVLLLIQCPLSFMMIPTLKFKL